MTDTAGSFLHKAKERALNVGLRSYAFFKARLLGLVALSGITGAIMHYGLAIALTIAVFIVREHLSVSYSQGPLLILFMFPIICSALIGGLGPGLFATALAGLGTLYFNIPPTGSFLVSSAADLVHWSMLIVNGILVSLLSRALLRAKTGELEQWRRRAASQESLRLNEALFKVVFERAALGIAVVSLDGHWLKVNRRICEMLGYTSDELLQLTFQDITYPEDLQADLDQVRRLLNGDIDNYSMEKRYRCKNNQLMWGELNVALVHKIDGSPDYFISTITDIQARKESEIALTETRRLAGVGAWLWDVKSNVHIWSPEIYRLYGLDPEAPPITYPEVRRYFTGDSWSRLSEAINKALGAGSPYQCDADVVRADGSHCTITARGEAIQDMNGVIIGLRATMQDITERKRAEDQLHQIQEQALTEQRQARLNTLTLMEDANNARTRAEATIVALRESQQRLMLAEESAHIGIWDWNIAGNQCYWSPECHRLYGMEPGELKTQDQWRSRVYPEDLALIDAQWQTRILLHKPFEVEFRMRLPSGEMRWITSKGSARYDPEGNPVRLIGINIDISKRKQTEEQLSKLAQAVEQSGESVIITNLNAEIEYVNAALLGNTGYSLDEVIGRNPRLLKSGKTPLANFKDMWANLRDGRSWKGEFVNKRKNGSEYVEFAIITPIRGHDGRITHYVSVQEDITERKQLGEELNRYRDHLEDMVERRTAELAEARAIADAANQAKSEFLANMSHEIRTPMNAIIGLSYLLRRSELTSAQSDRLDKINAAAQHLLSIINDILDLSKIEAGCIELEQTDFSLVSLLDQIRSLIGEQAHNKGLTIDLRHEQMPSSLRGDSTRLRQALLNYASNAVKFTDHGGITLSAGIIEEDENGLLVRFQVEDSGVGIAAEKLPTLFNPFVQADVSTTRRYGGTGLGLAITERLAELMGGQSREGQGSKFWFTARLQRSSGVSMILPSKPVSDPHAVLRRNYANASVLVVEDNPINREVACDLLNAVNLRVDTAENGLQAIEKINDHRYDLVLMDIQMPVMDGLTATRTIRANPQWLELPILAMTANAFNENCAACLAAGMNDFVAKPVIPDALYSSILQWLPVPKQGQDTSEMNAAEAVEPASAIPGTFPDLDIPGLDVAQGLAVVGYDHDKYHRLLQMFVQSHGSDMQLIQQWLVEGNRQQCKKLSHALKGVAATLGFIQIAKLTTNLEQSLHCDANLETCMALAKECEIEFTRVASAIMYIAQQQAQTRIDSNDQNPQLWGAVSAELEKLLIESDTRANQLLEEHADLLRTRLGTHYAEFARRIGQFDYEDALTILMKG